MTTPEETGRDDRVATATIPLAPEGAGHTRADWERAAAAVLRKSGRLGADDPDDLVLERLTRRTLDGIGVSPLGTADLLDDAVTAGRPDRAGAWDIRVLVDGERGVAARADALAELDGGATSLWVRAGGADLGALLEGVLLDVAPVVLEAPAAPLAAAEALVAAAGDTTLHPDTNLGLDPLGDAVRAGGHPAAAEQFLPMVRLAREAGVRAVVVDATAVHDLGASDVQELAYSLAAGIAYLRRLTEDPELGLDVAAADALLEFRYAATDEQFPTIAKLRAARRLWSRVLELSGLELTGRAGERPQRQHAVTSRPMMSRYDPWVNMLRTTVAAFAAGAGGADAVTVLPFDSPLGVPDAFGRRIARNTSSLLIHESHVARVTDPAGGAYAVERLTDDLAVAAWAELERIEEAGGIEAALADGSLRGRIDEVVAERDRQVARRRRPITGLSEFPNLAETLPAREPHAAGAWEVRSYGHAFEALRDAPAAAPVFLATMGTVAAHTARATFAANLLAAGGIATINPGRADDVDAVIAGYREAGSTAVVCLTGADTAYAEWGAPLVAALREAGARWVILAGKAPEGVEVDDTCAMGLDALDFLTRTREKLS